MLVCVPAGCGMVYCVVMRWVCYRMVCCVVMEGVVLFRGVLHVVLCCDVRSYCDMM